MVPSFVLYIKRVVHYIYQTTVTLYVFINMLQVKVHTYGIPPSWLYALPPPEISRRQ